MIAIVHYGIGNLDSVARAFRKCDAEVTLADTPEALAKADHIVLPGVGSFAKAMDFLNDSGLLPVLEQKVHEDHTPILGICLGFQMFTKYSEEGNVAGLGWIDGETKRFRFDELDPAPKMPHLGWNDVQRHKDGPLFANVPQAACFYFAHSYCVSCTDTSVILGTTSYGYEYVSAVQRDNIFGTQFHPEKSHAAGLQLIRNFIGYQHHA